MKSVFKKITALVLAVITLISFSSCGEEKIEGYKKYTEYGAIFWLPENMRQLSVSYANLCYDNGEATVQVNCYEADSLPEIGHPKDVTVKRFTEKYIKEFKLGDVEISFSEDENVATFFAEMTFRKGEPDEETVLYYHLITRTEHILYDFAMYCDASLSEKYKPEFLTWASYINIPQ